MRNRAEIASTIAGVACVFMLLSSGIAAASAPIRAHQHFVGVVNGKRATAGTLPVVYTACAGPIWTGRTGHVTGGQTVAVRHVTQGGGYTGPFRHIYAWFVQDSSSDGPQQVTLTRYRSPVAIPTSVQVPCDGTGQVHFSSCPYLAPCAAGWTPTEVTVRFENIAA